MHTWLELQAYPIVVARCPAPLREAFLDDPENRSSILPNHLQPAPYSLRREINSAEENPCDQVADLVRDGLIRNGLDSVGRRRGAIGV